MIEGASGVVSKGDFARLAGVSAARVSQYISQGQIGPEAMVGEGRAARINVAVAMRQLRDRLDLGQRLANGLGTRIDVPAGQGELPVAPAPAAAPPPVLPSREPTVEDQLKAEKLWRAKSDRRRREREERAEAGLYTRTEDASREMKRMAGGILEAIEGSLDGMARAISARFEVPTRDVLHLMRGHFRGVREEIARDRRAAVATLVETIEDPVADDDGAADDEFAGLMDDSDDED